MALLLEIIFKKGHSGANFETIKKLKNRSDILVLRWKNLFQVCVPTFKHFFFFIESNIYKAWTSWRGWEPVYRDDGRGVSSAH